MRALSLFVITITLGVQKHLDWKYGSAVLIITILFGLAIANYDVVSKLKMGGLEVETVRVIEQAKLDALSELEAHGETLKTLMRQGNELATRLEEQHARVESILTNAQVQEARLHFSELKMRASAGSRSAYEELLDRKERSSGDDQKEIELTLRFVALNHGGNQLYIPTPIIYEDGDGKVVQLENITVERILQDWGPETGFTQKQVIDTLCVKKDKNAIPFILEKLRTEEDLFVCAAAIHCLNELTVKSWL